MSLLPCVYNAFQGLDEILRNVLDENECLQKYLYEILTDALNVIE